MPDPLLTLSAINFGANALSKWFGKRDEDRFLRKAHEAQSKANLIGALSKGRVPYNPNVQFKRGMGSKISGLVGEVSGAGASFLNLKNLVQEQNASRAFRDEQRKAFMNEQAVKAGSQLFDQDPTALSTGIGGGALSAEDQQKLRSGLPSGVVSGFAARERAKPLQDAALREIDRTEQLQAGVGLYAQDPNALSTGLGGAKLSQADQAKLAGGLPSNIVQGFRAAEQDTTARNLRNDAVTHGMGIADKRLALSEDELEILKTNSLQKLFATMDKLQGASFEDTQSLRKEFTSVAGDFIKVRDTMQNILALSQDPSHAGDLAIMISYMKMLDPTSVVSPGEQANVQNSANIPEKIRGMYNRAIGDEKFAESVRADFVNKAFSIYEAQQNAMNGVIKGYEGFATKFKLDPNDVITPGLKTPLTNTYVGELSPEEEKALIERALAGDQKAYNQWMGLGTGGGR